MLKGGGGGGGGAGGLRCIPLEKKSKRVSADEEDDEDDYGKRDYMYGCTYVPTLDMHTCTCLVPYMRFPVQIISAD